MLRNWLFERRGQFGLCQRATWLVVVKTLLTVLTVLTYWHSEDAVNVSREITNNVQGYALEKCRKPAG